MTDIRVEAAGIEAAKAKKRDSLYAEAVSGLQHLCRPGALRTLLRPARRPPERTWLPWLGACTVPEHGPPAALALSAGPSRGHYTLALWRFPRVLVRRRCGVLAYSA